MDEEDFDFVCVLRATKRGPGLGALLRASPRVRPDAAWKAGTRPAIGKLVGPVRKENGFNLFIAEGAEWKPVAAAVRRRVRALSPMIEAGRRIGAKFELDIGVMLGGSRYWTRSTRFGPKDLAPLVDLGVELCVTAYPVSEEKATAPRERAARRSGLRGARSRGR